MTQTYLLSDVFVSDYGTKKDMVGGRHKSTDHGKHRTLSLRVPRFR